MKFSCNSKKNYGIKFTIYIFKMGIQVTFQDNVADRLKAWIQIQIHLTSKFLLLTTTMLNHCQTSLDQNFFL